MTSILPAKEYNASTLNPSVSPSSDAPIGLFDSGIGGLSVYLHLRELLPNEQYVYYADTLNMPYGARSKEDITRLTLKAVKWLVNVGSKIVVLACNSASAHALHVARDMYPNVPIVGLVPALKPAVLSSETKQVAVLATKATLDGKLLNDVIHDFAVPNGVQVTKWFYPQLVPWVELGMDRDSRVAKILIEKLHKFAEKNIDYMVLGCTHYPFFRDFLLEEISRCNLGISVIDSGAAVALRVYNILLQRSTLSQRDLKEVSVPVVTLASDIYIGLTLDLQFNEQNESNQSCVVKNKPSNANANSKATNKDAAIEKGLKNNVFELENNGLPHNQLGDVNLAFYMTDPNTKLPEISTKIKRLLCSQ